MTDAARATPPTRPVALASARRPEPAAPFGGWSVVAGAFLVTMVGYGAIYSYAAFAEEIGTAFGAERASVAVVYALSGGSCFFVSALTGPLADRIGARILAGTGMLLVGLGFLVAAVAQSLVEVYVGYGVLIGLGCGFAYVPAIAAVQRGFDIHRGLASGIAVSGIGIGTALVPPVVRSRAFVIACGGTLLVSMPAALPHALLVGTARDLGFDRHDSVALLGLIGLGTIIGRFLLSALADAIGRRAVFLACCGGMSASMLLWAAAERQPALQAFALGFGALQGGFVALLPAFVADSFGARRVGGVLGVLYTSRGIALLAAPPLLALGIAAMAGHALPVVAIALLGAAGTLLLARVAPAR